MKTLEKIQLAVTIIALLVAVRLADNIEPTTNELIGSVALVLAGGLSAIQMAINSEKKAKN